MYTYLAPSGVTVYSCKPESVPKWWDRFPQHLVWSYASWVSWVLADHGRWGLRRHLRDRGWWT